MSKKGRRDFFGLDDELFYKRKYAFFQLQSQIFSRSEFIIRTEWDWRSFFYSLEYPTDRLVVVIILIVAIVLYICMRRKFHEREQIVQAYITDQAEEKKRLQKVNSSLPDESEDLE